MPNQNIQSFASALLPKYCLSLPTFVSNSIGKKPSQNSIASNSHYNDPIKERIFNGNSRVWSDANNEVKLRSINQIIDEAIRQKLSLFETSLALSVGFIESGFNPDAASHSTSASGLGQVINKTGAAYGLNDENRFNIEEGAFALVSEIKSDVSRSKAELSSANNQEIAAASYARYHDGIKVTEETLNYSRSKIPNLLEKFTEFLSSNLCFVSEAKN